MAVWGNLYERLRSLPVMGFLFAFKYMTEDFMISLIIGLIVIIFVLISIIRDKRKPPKTWGDKLHQKDY